MMRDDFLEYVQKSSEAFKNLEKQTVRIIGHHDSDGLSATSILVKCLERAGYNICVSVVKQITEKLITEIANESYSVVFFVDLGSGSIEDISRILKEKNVFILDHHSTSKINTHVFNVNPLLFDVDGGKEVSGAGVTYLFSKSFDNINKDLAYIALIGAIGDVQENKGFHGINSEIILKDAIESGRIEVKQGLTLFGAYSRPLHKMLEYSTNPFIPGVSGSEIGAIKFLENLGIKHKDKDVFRKMSNLTSDEMKTLITGIILTRVGSEDNPDDILGNVYLLKDEDVDLLKDLKEFSTLLNACGRLEKYATGIGTCLGISGSKKEAIKIISEYKMELVNGLNWFHKNRGSNKIIEKEKYVILNAGEEIKETLIGTVISIMSKTNLFKSGVILIGMAYTNDGLIKVSFRITGNADGINLKELSSIISGKCDNGVTGGHKEAAGALIKRKDENTFIKACNEVINGLIKEEKI